MQGTDFSEPQIIHSEEAEEQQSSFCSDPEDKQIRPSREDVDKLLKQQHYFSHQTPESRNNAPLPDASSEEMVTVLKMKRDSEE